MELEDSPSDNLICQCENNCHLNCTCTFYFNSKFWCSQIAMNSKCKVCGCNVDKHERKKKNMHQE